MIARDFTIGEVARLSGLSKRHAAKCIDSGLLPGYRLPGRKDRRVTRKALRAFLEQHNMPVPEQLNQQGDGAAVCSTDPATMTAGPCAAS